MKNRENWSPTKFVYRNGKLRASKNSKNVNVASRIIVDIIAEFYGREIKNHVKGKLLDLGCGQVPLYEAYKSYVDDNICVDWENTLHKNDYLDMTVDLNNELPFPNDNFDTVILSDVLEHIRYPEKLITEIKRILKDGGKLMLNVPFYYHIHEQPHDYFRYTQYALKSFAEKIGLTIVKLESVGGLLLVLGDIISKAIVGIPIIGNLAASFLHFTVKGINKTNLGKRISEKSKDKFPLVIFMIVEKIS